MKKQLLNYLGMLGLLMVAGSAFAQSVNVRANIPFSFNIGKDTLPAGQYEVSTISSSGALLINNREANKSNMFITNAVTASHAQAYKSKLVFKQYGGQYFLSQIWRADSDTGRELLQSTRERELVASHAPAEAVVMAELR